MSYTSLSNTFSLHLIFCFLFCSISIIFFFQMSNQMLYKVYDDTNILHGLEIEGVGSL
jgi:hypothetical protein